MCDVCCDDRWEVIAAARDDLLRSTNIQDSPSEMAVLDDFLFRCWQMGWLDKYITPNRKPTAPERYPAVVQAAEAATGHTLTNARSRANTLIRAFVSYRMHEEGYSNSEIGRELNRDHSTVTQLAGRMREMLSMPVYYSAELKMFENMNKML